MKIVLFDMDGTLTPAREKMDETMLSTLIDLQREGYDIGIVSGSDMDYITEQCSLLFEVNSFDYRAVHWFPCNGTKYYRFYKSGSRQTVYENDMIKLIGKKDYRFLISTCINVQKHIVDTTDCPLTGKFFDYRGSTLNWCPIGRLADKEDRLKWIDLDESLGIRQEWLAHIKFIMKKQGINSLEFKLGGDTSFDIFPTGWDKTFVLQNFSKSDEIFFIGDRCGINGNDKELYDAVKLRLAGDSFQTNGPSKTITIINNRILQHPSHSKG